jgi:hypothetical protein
MAYCPNCGKEVSEDDTYCSFCRTPLKADAQPRYSRREVRSEKGEKDEKDEKRDDDQAGAVVGGLVVIWLGASLLLKNMGYFGWTSFGGVFLLGIGVILILRGLYAYVQTNSFDQAFGFLIGGVVVSLIGGNIVYDIQNWWAIFLVILGAFIIVRSFTERRRNPRP